MSVQYKMVNASELAEMIVNAEFGKKFDFTFDRLEDLENKKPTGWYGVTRIKIFDEPQGWLIFGDYGACGLPAYDIEAESNRHIAESTGECSKRFITERLEDFFMDESCADTVCLEVDDIAIKS